ncbi:MAG: HAD-IIB family hydrolase [Clostridia bacterium]|nr:HAD-IIB family hydrolase [Clostridia bacterium]
MGKFDGILICSDFDGTFAHKAKISEQNLNAVKYFQSEGGMFVPASGRPWHFFEQFAPDFVPSRYIIGLNGAEIYDTEAGCAVYRHALDKPHALALAHDMLQKYPELSCVYIHTVDGGDHHSLDGWQSAELIEGDIFKMVFVVITEASDRVISELEDFVPERYTVERSWINGIELMDKDNVKGASVRRLREMLGGRARRVICVGDYENDISMLREADIGYAVNGAPPVVRAAADRMTVRVTEGAVAHVIEDIENELRTAPGSFWREVI